MGEDIAIKYVSRVHTSFYDRLYGSGLTFERGQSRMVPALLAQSLLTHAGEFELGEAMPKAEAVDDTKEVMTAKQKRDDKDREQLNERQDVVDSIQTMDKEALKEYAQQKYGQAIPKTMTVENMRVKVVALIDQFGLV